MNQQANQAQDAFPAADATPRAVAACRRPGAWGSVFKLGGALMGGLALGLVVHTCLGSGSAGVTWDRISQWAGGTNNVQVQLWPRLMPTSRGQALATPAAFANLDASVLVRGERHPASQGPVALPAGTRFQVSVSASQAGRLEVHAINPNGETQAQPLWTTPVRPGSTVSTPNLRLNGTRGLETLSLVLRGPQGEALVERQVQIWHL